MAANKMELGLEGSEISGWLCKLISPRASKQLGIPDVHH